MFPCTRKKRREFTKQKLRREETHKDKNTESGFYLEDICQTEQI